MESMACLFSQNANAGNAPSSLSTTLLWIPVLFSVVLYIYLVRPNPKPLTTTISISDWAGITLQNPTIVTKFLEEFIGFSEHYDGAPVAQQPSIMHLSADTSKRDAVVSAFKVRKKLESSS